jgi:hypothetical protein
MKTGVRTSVGGLQDAEAGRRRRIGLQEGEHVSGTRVRSMEFRADDNTSGKRLAVSG